MPAVDTAAVAVGSEGVAVAITVVATLVVVAVIVATLAGVRAVRELRLAAAELARQVEEVRRAVDGTLAHTTSELARVDDLIGSAEHLTDTVGAASRLAYAGVASPVIKVMAFTRGTTRAGRALRTRSR